MNQNAKKWIATLRSGEFKQGKAVLLRDNKYCCLGVACELFIRDGGQLAKAIVADAFGETTTFHGMTAELPPEVVSWLGLTRRDGYFYTPEFESLTRLNDRGLVFEAIADIIESEPKGLFREQPQATT